MKQLSRTSPNSQPYPARILQFGEGNFIRAFIGARIEQLNQNTDFNGGITLIRRTQPVGKPDLNDQQGLYSVVTRGIDDQGAKRESTQVIHCVTRLIATNTAYDHYLATAEDPDYRFVFSQTTEAGIEYDDRCMATDRPPRTFPAKLTQWLYQRFSHFDGNPSKGLIIIPCELVDSNGLLLKKFILAHATAWQLPVAFSQWLEDHNHFCNTLVDQICTSFPKEDRGLLEKELGFIDPFMIATELYTEFVIDGPDCLREELFLDQVDLSIKLVADVTPYSERKIAVLNGSHSAMVPLALLGGFTTVREAISNVDLGRFTDQLQSREVIPNLSLPQEELSVFKKAVFGRFNNPYIEHQLMAITLNSLVKYKVRLVPQVLHNYTRHNRPPLLLSTAFAAQILLYRGNLNGEPINLKDDVDSMALLQQEWAQYSRGKISMLTLVQRIFSQQSIWGTDLNALPGWADAVCAQLKSLMEVGALVTIQAQLQELI